MKPEEVLNTRYWRRLRFRRNRRSYAPNNRPLPPLRDARNISPRSKP